MRTLDARTLRDFEEFVRSKVPGFEVQFKDESKLMAVLGFLAAPFNAEFMTRYTTTWGKQVFFPNQSFYQGNPAKSFRILAHELVHLLDGERHATFKVSYVFPQWLVVLPLIAFAVLAWPHSWLVLLPFVSYVLACAAAKLSRVLMWIVLGLLLAGTGVLAWWLTGWWAFVLLGSVLFLIPWPAYWRTKWEIHGYGMNVVLAWVLYQAFSDRYLDAIVKQFTGPGYYFMCWSGAKIRAAMTGYHLRAKSGEILKGHSVYAAVYDFLQEGS